MGTHTEDIPQGAALTSATDFVSSIFHCFLGVSKLHFFYISFSFLMVKLLVWNCNGFDCSYFSDLFRIYCEL